MSCNPLSFHPFCNLHLCEDDLDVCDMGSHLSQHWGAPCPQLCKYIVSELTYVLSPLRPWIKRQYISKVLDLIFGKLCWQAEAIAVHGVFYSPEAQLTPQLIPFLHFCWVSSFLISHLFSSLTFLWFPPPHRGFHSIENGLVFTWTLASNKSWSLTYIMSLDDS